MHIAKTQKNEDYETIITKLNLKDVLCFQLLQYQRESLTNNQSQGLDLPLITVFKKYLWHKQYMNIVRAETYSFLNTHPEEMAEATAIYRVAV